MEGVAYVSFTSFATKSLSFSALSPAPIITRHQNHRKNTPKSISNRNLVIRASSGSVVTLLDYGAGNVRSLRNTIRYLGFDIQDVRTPKDILNAERLIFPGVGAFASAIDVLTKTGMDEALSTYIKNDRPFLGICLGLQLLFESSEENGPVNGLGLIPGVVGRFDSSNGFRVPHIGWNALQIAKDSEILDEIGDYHVYFVHSYRAMPHLSEGEMYMQFSSIQRRVEVRNLGKPVELAGQYYKDGADEVSFLNITGFRDFPLGDLPMLQVLRCTSENVFVPLTVGGGIRDFTDANGRWASVLDCDLHNFPQVDLHKAQICCSRPAMQWPQTVIKTHAPPHSLPFYISTTTLKLSLLRAPCTFSGFPQTSPLSSLPHHYYFITTVGHRLTKGVTTHDDDDDGIEDDQDGDNNIVGRTSTDHPEHYQQLGATILASKFAANTRKGSSKVDSLKMPKIYKPAEPDFSVHRIEDV
ncbi:hypothetical protein PTKIN_Ptkin08bG0037500 [Pterospermum kingtungense]